MNTLMTIPQKLNTCLVIVLISLCFVLPTVSTVRADPPENSSESQPSTPIDPTEEKWYGSNGRTYYIHTSNTVITDTDQNRSVYTTISYINRHGRKIIFKGNLLADGSSRMTFRPRTLEDLDFKGDLDIRDRVIQGNELDLIAKVAKYSPDKLSLLIQLPRVKVTKTSEGETTVSIVRNGPSQFVNLTRKPVAGYRIGKIVTESQVYETRLEADRKRLLKKRGQQEEKAKALKKRLEQVLLDIAPLDARHKALDKDAKLTAEKAMAREKVIDKQLKEIDPKIGELVKQFEALKATKNDPTERTPAIDKNIERTKSEIRALVQTRTNLFRNDQAYQRLSTHGRQLALKNRELLTQLEQLAEKKDVLVQEVDQLTLDAAVTKKDLLRVDAEIKAPRVPGLIKITASTSTEPIFIAESVYNKDFVKTLDDEIARTEAELEQSKETDGTLAAQKELLNNVRKNYRTQWNKAAEELKIASEKVYGKILEGAAQKSVTEILAAVADYTYAFSSGGPSNLYAEISQKAGEAIANLQTGNLAFESYDEAELKKLFDAEFKKLEATTLTPENVEKSVKAHIHAAVDADSYLSTDGKRDAASFAKNQLVKSPFVVSRELIQAGIERSMAKRDYKELVEKTATREALSKEIRAENQRQQQRVGKQFKVVKKSSEDAAAKGRTVLKKVYDEKLGRLIEKKKDLIQKRKLLEKRLTESLKPGKSAEEIRKRLKDTSGISKRNSVLQGLAVGLAVEMTKAFFNTFIDQDQKEAWTNFFAKEIYYKMMSRLNQEASRQYWAFDDEMDKRWQQGEAYVALVHELKIMKANYAQSVEETGLFVQLDETFDPKWRSTIEITLKTSPLAKVTGVRFAADDLEDTSFIEGQPQGGDQFEFNVSALKQKQSTVGPVPVLIRLE